MQNAFSPTESMLRGQQFEQGLSQAELEGQALREKLALKKAAGALGSQNYFAGYEGVKGAERPDYLKEAWADADPAEAYKLESIMAEPFKLNRAAEQAGKIEAAKKASDLTYNQNLMRDFLGPEGQNVNAFGSQADAGPSQTSGGVMPVSASTGSAPALSATERSFEVGPQGPKFSMKRMSPFEQLMKQGEDSVRRENLTLAKNKEASETLQQAHTNVRAVMERIQAVQKAMQSRDIPWQDGQQEIGQLQQELATFTQQRDQLLRSKQAVSLAPSAPGLRSIPAQATTASPALTQKEQGALTVRDQEERRTAANKEIAGAREHALKIAQFQPQLDQIYDLATQHELGSPVISSIPGGLGTTALMMRPQNVQFKNVNDALTNLFVTPGSSQLMNTIIERQMTAAALPGLANDPQQNKMNAAALKSNTEHLKQFPSFLEKWAKTHSGTLDGATEAWLDYTQHNPMVTATKDKRGKVQVKENHGVIAPEKWLQLRAQGRVKTLKNGTVLVQEPD